MNVAYNMDCMEYMRSLPDKAFDLAVVDPPYGGGATAQERERKEAEKLSPMENLTLLEWENEEYRAFTEKFKTKKTTDDCYTPPLVFQAIADWVTKNYGIDQSRFSRPFYPGGDYQKEDYSPGTVVVDNPPFSILASIIRFYRENKIQFFLFAPALTLFNYSEVTTLPIGATIIYENGATVTTSFVTNLEPTDIRVKTYPELYEIIEAAVTENKAKTEMPKYIYPDEIITAAMVQRWCKYGVDYTLTVKDSLPIKELDEQKILKKSIFGGGFILGSTAAAERAAAERAAAERAAAKAWQLSEREKQIVDYIDKRRKR